ncbi:MAG: peptide deformylase, partial [Sphingobacteriaceae bacterium]|nr:peptide deformylase [Cytophagaceae bacterium]
WAVENSLSELLQHEHDHLDGILATQRALDEKSFRWRI